MMISLRFSLQYFQNQPLDCFHLCMCAVENREAIRKGRSERTDIPQLRSRHLLQLIGSPLQHLVEKLLKTHSHTHTHYYSDSLVPLYAGEKCELGRANILLQLLPNLACFYVRGLC